MSFRRIRIVCLLFLAFINACRMGGDIQLSEFHQPNGVLPATITVANWNAQKGKDARFSEDLRDLIANHKPDIFFLQEARIDLIEGQEMGGYFANSWKYPWPGGTTLGVLTLSKQAPIRVKPVQSKWREFLVTAPKVSLITEYPLASGSSLLAVNVHLLNFERWGTYMFRSQLDELKSIMALHKGPIIMAGDFNTWSMKRLKLVRGLAKQLRLSEVADFPPGRVTGDLHLPFMNQLLGIKKDLVLDRIYYRGFKEHSSQVLPYKSSDHRPFLVSLTL
jgi:endonuclease/exonuclease/phosphatase (EEP) superfamily protein YafD